MTMAQTTPDTSTATALAVARERFAAARDQLVGEAAFEYGHGRLYASRVNRRLARGADQLARRLSLSVVLPAAGTKATTATKEGVRQTVDEMIEVTQDALRRAGLDGEFDARKIIHLDARELAALMGHLDGRLHATPTGAAPASGSAHDGIHAAAADIAVRALLFVASVVKRLHTVPEEAGGLAPN